MGPTVLFTNLKIILLQCFLFSVLVKYIISRRIFNVRLTNIIFVNFFYYSAYFLYFSWVSLHFLLLFMDFTILFQLTFTFIYSTFSKKNLVSMK